MWKVPGDSSVESLFFNTPLSPHKEGPAQLGWIIMYHQMNVDMIVQFNESLLSQVPCEYQSTSCVLFCMQNVPLPFDA